MLANIHRLYQLKQQWLRSKDGWPPDYPVLYWPAPRQEHQAPWAIRMCIYNKQLGQQSHQSLMIEAESLGIKGTGTKFKCPKCNVGLCSDPCFRLYHTKLNFWDWPTLYKTKHITISGNTTVITVLIFFEHQYPDKMTRVRKCILHKRGDMLSRGTSEVPWDTSVDQQRMEASRELYMFQEYLIFHPVTWMLVRKSNGQFNYK
jgi:hypothetical protein